MLLPPAFVLLFAILSPIFETNSALCSSSNSNKPPPPQLSPSQWAEQLERSPDANNTNSWLLKHIDELASGTFKLLVRQQSLDARRSDLVHLATSHPTGLDFGHYKFNSGDLQQDLLNQRLAAGARVSDEACRRHLQQMLELLEDLDGKVEQMRHFDSMRNERALDERHFRLAIQLDSFGRYESGQFGGKHHSFGIYDQCIRSPMLLASGTSQTNERTLVDSRYCWAHLNVSKHLSEPLRNGTPTGTNSRENSGAFHMAVCLPASCHSATFTSNPATMRLVQMLVDNQFLAPKSMYVNESLPVESVFCLVDDDSQLAAVSASGKLFIMLIVLWLLVCTCTTCWRSPNTGARSTQANNKYLLPQLDLGESWRDFWSGSERERTRFVAFSTLSLIEPLSGLGLVLLHAGIMTAPLNSAPIQLEANWMTRIHRLTLPSLLAVDSFFVLFWMRVTFVMLQKFGQNFGIDPQNRRQFKLNARDFCKLWLYISARLSLRLIPLYFLVFWFKKSLYVQIGSGPLWDFGLNEATPIGACQRETWLSPLTPLTTRPPLSQCLPQSWLISNALFFALALPPIIILLIGRFRLACLLALFTTVASLALTYSNYSTLKPESLRTQLEQFQLAAMLNVFKVASYIYTNPVNRLPVALVGVFAGYALNEYERKLPQEDTQADTSNSSAWPNWFRAATKNAISFVVVSLVMSFFVAEIGQGTSLGFKKTLMSYFVLSGHLNWALANAIIFLRLATDWHNGNHLLRLASSKFPRIVAKLTLSLWLIHWDLLAYGVQIAGQSNGSNYAETISLALVNMIVISFLVHVGFENPANQLIKALCNRRLSPLTREMSSGC